MEEQSITIFIGIPASGKDTQARAMCAEIPDKYAVTNRDTIRTNVFTDSGSIHDYRYTKAKETQVTKIQLNDSRKALEGGRSVIVSDTNLNPKTRKVWVDLAAEMGVPIAYKVMDTPLHTCIKRNAKRAEYVPESVLIRMEQVMRKYQGKYFHDTRNPDNLPECVIFDIDGTLADMKGVRTPFEWDKVGLDKPREFVCDHLLFIARQGIRTILFSGRDSVCREATIKWLEDRNIPTYSLYMREEGSQVPDTIVKEKMFDKHIKGKYHVNHIVDDRKAVCQMWESMGFEVMNVGGFLADF